MDPALSSLFPIHQIGADGFSWWIGQVESNKNEDPKNSGRYRVRIVGQHLKSGDATPTNQLPWAQVMMPVTTPFSDGGKTGASVGLNLGNWVVGFYVDNDKQKPIIMGSIGHTAGATKLENVEQDPNPNGTEKGFTTYLDSTISSSISKPMGSDKKRNGNQPAATTIGEDKELTKPGDAGEIAAAVPGQMPSAFYGLFAEASTTNPTGNKVCVEIADPTCGSENDLKGGLTKIIGDMLKATQQSGGNIGTYYVSQINGELNSYIDSGMEYVNKAVRLVKSFVARVKGEIVKLVREGVDELVDLILYTDAATTDALGNTNTGPVAPDLGIEPFQPITKKESRIKPVLDTINDVLDDLGCEMADFTERIARWLTDLLLGYLMDAFSNAACLVDNVVNGILNQLMAFIEELLGNILGPLQQILGALASPLDMIGNAINNVLNLLGISCDGPAAQCQKTKKECVDCGTDDDEDWLDKLLRELEDGPLDGTTYVCDEARNTSVLDNLPDNGVNFIGGTYPDGESDPNEDVSPADLIITYSCEDVEVTEGEQAIFTITRGGNIARPSSLTMSILGGTATLDEDYAKIFSGSSIGFAPGETTRTIVFETYVDSETEGEETFFIRLEPNMTPQGLNASFPTGSVFKGTITDAGDDSISPGTGGGDNVTPTPFVPPNTTTTNPILVTTPVQSVTFVQPIYNVSADKIFYKEGETIRYTITTENVVPATFTYTLEGDIDAGDIVGGNLTGSFTLDADGGAIVDIELATNTDEDDNAIESITFFIDNTPAYADAFIVGDDDILSTDIFWTVTNDVNYIDEGETVTFTVGALNAPDGLNFTYELSGNIISRDIVGTRLESSVDVDAAPLKIIDEECIIPIQAAIDSEEESQEYFDFIVAKYNVGLKFSLDEINPAGSAGQTTDTLNNVKMIIDGSEYDLDHFDIALVRPGMPVTINIASINIPDNTTIESVDAATNTIVLSDDITWFTGQEFTANAYREIENVNAQVIIRSEIDEDDDTTPTYKVESDKFTYAEGETIVYTVTTTNVPNGTVLQYNLFGENISKDDFVSGSLFGNFVVIENEAKVYVSIADDTEVEGIETVRFSINGTNAFAEIIIDDRGEIIDPPIINPKKPCFDKPRAGNPITDSNGSIISIPIIEQGCPYVFPPKVIITGPGYGSSAIALLDDSGRVSEIRVTRTGRGYKLNQNPELRCVIDSYTLLNPGSGYTSTPDVYVDGVADRAIAVIDDRGYVVSVQPTDRTSTWNEIPLVRIVGGGGSGARVLPSVTCLDNKTYEDQGYAKIGTGKYVDCP
jgi:hypothetical protein